MTITQVTDCSATMMMSKVMRWKWRLVLSDILANIGLGNGLLPVGHQAITGTNTDFLTIGPLGTNFNWIWIKIHKFYFNKRLSKTLSAKQRPFCSGLKKLTIPETGPGSAFIKPDQHNPWIKDQLGNALLSTILHLQLPNFVSCGRDKPSHMTQNLVTVGAKL